MLISKFMNAFACQLRSRLAQAERIARCGKATDFQRFSLLCLLLALTGCAGFTSTTLPPRSFPHDPGPLLASSKPLTIGVKSHPNHEGSDALITTLKATELFDEVAYLEDLSAPPSLVATLEDHGQYEMTCPVPTLLTLGLIPTRTVENHGQLFALHRPGNEAHKIVIDQRYQAVTTIGWVALLKALSPNETLLTPERHARYRQALRQTILAHTHELARLAHPDRSLSAR